MKKAVSILLCCIMMVSIFTASAAQVYAANEVSSYFNVTNSGLVDDKITYTISITPGQSKLIGVSLRVKYDGDMLAVDSCNVSEKFAGMTATGDAIAEDTYSIAYISSTGVNITSSEIAFAEITFNMIGAERDYTSVEFICVEFITDDGVENDHEQKDGEIAFADDTFFTLSAPTVSKVYSTISELVVEWNSVEGAESYNVYRKVAGGDWASIATGVTDTQFIDDSIEIETEYIYNVTAVNAYGETAITSAGVAGLNFGSIDSISATAVADGAYITWSKLALAKSYNIYRKEASQSNEEWTLVGSSTVNSYTDKTLDSYVEYNYRVEAVKDNYLAGLSVAYPTVKYLAMPEFAITNTEKGIEVYYGDVNGANKYVIEKKTGNGAWQTLVTVNDPAEDVYLDEAVVANGSYAYRIKAYASDISSAYKTLSAITRLGTPTVKSISVDVPGMTITWSPVSGATEYKIYRKVYGTNQLTVIGTAVGTSYTDTTAQSNVVYTYTVSAANNTGCGMYDKVGKTRIFFASPVLKSRENVVNGVKITWTPIEGATGYRIYRRGAGTNYWHYLGTYDASKTYYVDYGKDANGKNIGMKNGDYYRYTVRATNENRGSNVKYPGGYNQTIYSGFDPTGLYLKHVSTPKMVSVSNASKGVLVKWKAVSGATKYRVYRRGEGSTYWYFLGEVSGTSFTDTAIANASGKYYRYTVRAVSGYYSGFDANGLFLMRLSDPVLTSARSYSSGITVKWKQVAGASGYYVYRKTSGSSWSRIATISGVTKVSYTDKTAKKGTTYIYTVKAFRGKTMSSCDLGGISCRAKY